MATAAYDGTVKIHKTSELFAKAQHLDRGMQSEMASEIGFSL